MDSGFLEALREAYPFPDPEAADEHGLLAWGGDLSAERLLAAYASGVFPWFDEPPILWFSPEPRALIPPGEIHIGRSLSKTLRKAPYELRFDTAFDRVVEACASVERPGQDGTWINDDMVEAYARLHTLGFAHSVEAWDAGELVGGLYGVSLGGGFFGESMFALAPDASKVAFASLAQQLEAWGFDFIDCQLENDHVNRFGAQAWPRRRFLGALAETLRRPTLRGRWVFGGSPRGT